MAGLSLRPALHMLHRHLLFSSPSSGSGWDRGQDRNPNLSVLLILDRYLSLTLPQARVLILTCSQVLPLPDPAASTGNLRRM